MKPERKAFLVAHVEKGPAAGIIYFYPMPREMCYRCFWPKPLCWCASITPIETATKIVILMHPKEFKQEKAATGRFTHLCLKNSEIHMGINFDASTRVQAILKNTQNYCMLLYPSKNAYNLSENKFPADAGNRRLVIFLLDATWYLAKKMLKRSPCLQALPRVMFVPGQKSRFLIKKQPHDQCLSTIEAAHELMLALEQAGLDCYDRPAQMIDLFMRMQRHQLECMADPLRQNYRRGSGRFRVERAIDRCMTKPV
jgi:DTW domain-containing protein YfiP